MAIRLVQNKDSGLVVRSTINDLVNYANSTPTNSVSGSFTVTQNLAGGIIMNPQTISSNITISAGYNAFVSGPIENNAEIIIESTANLTIL